ncbi:MAG: hypothetical protein COW63_15325 [Bacteroidetes bacterium CG18_big_fil_WC_8_21_14_2_50_41_14]|nr:MAG: hypothetical protein COW63_15325 [Bacteroidetes bacterium CG18_big_fil_WC_8_21_14_2_50_41_14]PJB55321.1 MAG: hypothetical protein CO098_16855 [Bacteroidetes bacterium CG_4_9_14_3_um_filter_41_19]
MNSGNNTPGQRLFITNKPLTIREATIADYVLLTDLWKKAGLPYKPNGRDSLESIAREMQAGTGVFFIGLLEEMPVATVLVTHDGRKGWINRLAVLPEFQKQGIGKQLVSASEKWLIQHNIGIFACMIEDYNTNSFIAFQKMGYIPFDGIHYLTKRLDPEI